MFDVLLFAFRLSVCLSLCLSVCLPGCLSSASCCLFPWIVSTPNLYLSLLFCLRSTMAPLLTHTHTNQPNKQINKQTNKHTNKQTNSHPQYIHDTRQIRNRISAWSQIAATNVTVNSMQMHVGGRQMVMILTASSTNQGPVSPVR